MKYCLLAGYFISLSVFHSHAQVYKGQVNSRSIPDISHHYQEEYFPDTIVNPAAWANQQKIMHVSFATTDESYFQREVPDIQEMLSFEATAWKGERVNAQILIWSPDTLRQVRVSYTDLRSKAGKVISKGKMRANLIRYVVSNYPYGARDAVCGENKFKENLYLMPDRFEPLSAGTDRFQLDGQTTRPIWVSLDIPAATEAGLYTGTIKVDAENYSVSLAWQVNVQNQLLPRPEEWKHRLDLWQNPWVVAWKNHLTPWSEEHKLLLKKHLKLYAEAGGTFITTYAVHSPWSDNSHMIEGGMIDWIKRKDGSWKFDYTIFDQYVGLAMSVGIKKAITIYTPVPWGFRFRYMDERTGNYVYESWRPSSSQFKNIWHVFLTDLKKHLDQKGWFKITYLGINENAMAQTLAAVKVIKEHSPQWKITYAGNWHPELDSLLDDYCFQFGNESKIDIVRERAARGQTTTYYVCCTPPFPNNFVFSPPVEGRWISWYSVAHEYDGFLRWAYDAWPSDEMRDARHHFWPAGDCYLVYPGGNSSIRFEKLREGFVDFEKIRILREKGKRSTDMNVQLLLQQLNEHLKGFLAEKDFNTEKLKTDLQKGRSLVERLSERLR